MKRFVTLVLLVCSTSALAGFELGKHVYRMDEFDKAIAVAKAKGEAITFVYTREDSTCGLCANASITAADKLRRDGVVIYAEAKDDWDKLPDIVKQALLSEAAGQYIPKTVVVNSDLSEVLATIPYASGDAFTDSIRDAQKNIKAKLKEASSSSVAVPVTSTDSKAIRTWKSTIGTALDAKLVRRAGYTVVLEKADGVQVRIDMSSLSEADRAFIASSGM